MAQASRKNLRLEVTFARADSVCAVGAFNNWSTVDTPLRNVDGERWELSAPVSEAEIEQLGFFVIAQGARCGRVISYQDVLHS